MLGNANIGTEMSKSIVTNCNIFVYDNSSSTTVLLNRNNILSFRMNRSNEGIINNAPNDTLVFEIINWNSLSSTAKTRFTTKGQYLKIGFSVGGYQTTYRLVQCVKECKVDNRHNRATLTLQSPFALMTGFNFIAEVSGKIEDRSSFPFVEETFNNYDSFPLRVKTTFFESVQLASISLGKGAVIPYVASGDTYPPAHKLTQPVFNQGDYYKLVDLTANSTSDITLDTKNILSDIVESIDENDRSQLYVYGLKTGTIRTLDSQTIWYGNDPSQPNDMVYKFEFDKQYVITSLSILVTHAGADVSDQFVWRISNNSVYAITKPTSSIGANVVVNTYGYDAEEIEKDPQLDNTDKVYTFLPTVLNGGTKASTAQSNMRSYYSKRTFIEFDCRFDPRIEPMDRVYISGVGRIRVEQISATFNGAFKAHIKGRLIYSE